MTHKHHDKKHEVSSQVKVKFKGEAGRELKYHSDGAAGFDIASDAYVELHPHKTVVVPTGLYLEIPEGFEIQIRPRSGFSFHNNVIIKNAPGTIDSDYRGEIKIILYNLDAHKTVHIKKGDRIAQGVIAPVYKALFIEDENHSTTERGEQGFGSTGQ